MGKRADDRYRVALSPALTRVHQGEDDLSEWDDDELRRGRRRDRLGRFPGPDPKIIPRAVHEELARRKFQQAFAVLYAELGEAPNGWRTRRSVASLSRPTSYARSRW